MATTTLTGTTGNDILNAPGSVSTLVAGFQGNDTITLVLPEDQTDAGQGNDKITVNGVRTQINTVVGGAGNDSLYFNTGNLLVQGSYGLNNGNDYLSFTAEGSYNNASFGLNGGADKLLVSKTAVSMTYTTIGGGSGADTVTISGGSLSNVQVLLGEGADQFFGGTGVSLASTTINGAKGHDTIVMSSGGSSTLVIAAGAGFDSINLSSVSLASLAGGAGNDTIALSVFGGGVIYGDGLGITDTVGASSASDRITASDLSAGTTIYGAGAADTIDLGVVSAAVLVDGGSGADKLGSSAVFLGTGGTLTINGGAGSDTILVKGTETAGLLINGGDGIDSIYIAASAIGSINGGAGNDTINANGFGNIQQSALSLTIQGGGGSDQILLGNITAGLLLCAGDLAAISSMAGNVIYSAGDSVKLLANGLAAASPTSIYILSAKQVLSALAGVTGTGQIIGVYVDTNDLVFAIRNGGDLSTNFNVFRALGGSSAVKTTVTGATSLDSSNFAFTVSNSTTGQTYTFG